MDYDLFYRYFQVGKIRGRNVFDIYKNYVTDLPRENIAHVLHKYFVRGTLTKKNDQESANLRQKGNTEYGRKNYDAALATYTKSLCYATHNSEAFAIALANRSLVLYKLEEYENCLTDISLCLEAQYPNKLKPKVLIRQAECFRKLQDLYKMRKVLVDLLELLDQKHHGLSDIDCDKYREAASNLFISKIEKVYEGCKNFCVIPTFEENPNFLGASTSVTLQYTKQHGRRVIANKDIAVGDVLFVEKSYAFITLDDDPRSVCNEYFYCDYCLYKRNNLIPCMKCVKQVYCNESCRLNAWNEFHQWECLAMQATILSLFEPCIVLALRILFKTARAGFIEWPMVKENSISQFGNSENNYPYLISSSTINLTDVSNDKLMNFAGSAAMLFAYLKLYTNFFKIVGENPNCIDMNAEQLMIKLGGSFIQHSMQYYTIVDSHSDVVTEKHNLCVIRPIGLLATPSIHLLNRSCAPNTNKYSVGDTVVIKAIQPIVQSQEITTSHLNNNYITLSHIGLMSVLANFNIKCKCEACIDPQMQHDAYNCVKCGGPALEVIRCMSKTFVCVCTVCNYSFRLPAETIHLEAEVQVAYKCFMSSSNMIHAFRCIEIAKLIYKPSHGIFISIFMSQLWQYEKEEDIVSLVLTMKKLLYHVSQRKLVDISLVKGDLQFRLLKMCLQLLENPTTKISKDSKEVTVDLKKFIEDAKIVYELHNPPMLTHISKLERRFQKLWDLQLKGTTTNE